MNISELIKERDASRDMAMECNRFLEYLRKHPFQDQYTKDLISKVDWYAKKAEGDAKLASMEVNEIIESTRKDCNHREVKQIIIEGEPVYECTTCHSILGSVPEGAKVVGSETYQ